ncbi:hypothetical protein GEMRC1_001619 [Eukaryota sp. GEM-RC1]
MNIFDRLGYKSHGSLRVGDQLTDVHAELCTTSLNFAHTLPLLAIGHESGAIFLDSYFELLDGPSSIHQFPISSSNSALLEFHSQIVQDVKFSTCDRYLLSSSSDKTACVWDLQHQVPLHLLQGHTGTVRSSIFLPSSGNSIIVSGGRDAGICIWDTRQPCFADPLSPTSLALNSTSPPCFVAESPISSLRAISPAPRTPRMGYTSLSAVSTYHFISSNDVGELSLWDIRSCTAATAPKRHRRSRSRNSSQNSLPINYLIGCSTSSPAAFFASSPVSVDPVYDYNFSNGIVAFTHLGSTGRFIALVSRSGLYDFDLVTTRDPIFLHFDSIALTSGICSNQLDQLNFLVSWFNGLFVYTITYHLHDGIIGGTRRSFSSPPQSIASCPLMPNLLSIGFTDSLVEMIAVEHKSPDEDEQFEVDTEAPHQRSYSRNELSLLFPNVLSPIRSPSTSVIEPDPQPRLRQSSLDAWLKRD